MTTTISPIGGTVTIADDEEGTYTVTQNETASVLENIAYNNNDSTVALDTSVGVVKAVGFLDLTTFDTGIDLFIHGLRLGSFFGNLKDGLYVSLDLFTSSGKITVFLKNGNEVHMSVQLRMPSESVDRSVKMTTF